AAAGGRPGRFGRHTQGVLAGRGFGRGDERERRACPAAGDEARVHERQGGARGAPRGAGGEACGELGGVLCGNEITNRDVAQRRNTKTYTKASRRTVVRFRVTPLCYVPARRLCST